MPTTPRVLGLCLSRTGGNYGWREWSVLPAGPDAAGRYVVKLPCAFGDHYLALASDGDGQERVGSRQAPYYFPDRATAEAALERYAAQLGAGSDGRVDDPYFIHGSPERP